MNYAGKEENQYSARLSVLVIDENGRSTVIFLNALRMTDLSVDNQILSAIKMAFPLLQT